MSAEQESLPLLRTLPPMTFPGKAKAVKPSPSSEAPSDDAGEEQLDANSPVVVEQAKAKGGTIETTASRESKYQVVLDVLSPGDTRKLWLSNDQRLQVGRTSEADLSFPLDQRMSHLHFALECQADACHLHDLGSCNGTVVNEVPVQSTILRDGDRIQAGDTLFCVHIHGGLQPSSQEVAAHTTADNVHQAPLSATIRFEREALPNGLLCIRGETAESDPAIVATRLNVQWPLYFLVDLGKVNLAIRDETRTANRLMDWFPPDAASPLPVLLSAKEYPDIAALIGAAWGSDALVCLFTKLDARVLLHLLRAAIRGERVRPILKEHPDHLVGIHIPSILETMLRTGPVEMWNETFPDVNAVLLESENRWELFMPVEDEQRLPMFDMSAAAPNGPESVDSSGT